ncbi:MAG: hypothetical protein ACR2M1_03505 [Gemmatimonadaceae bacterium]
MCRARTAQDLTPIRHPTSRADSGRPRRYHGQSISAATRGACRFHASFMGALCPPNAATQRDSLLITDERQHGLVMCHVSEPVGQKGPEVIGGVRRDCDGAVCIGQPVRTDEGRSALDARDRCVGVAREDCAKRRRVKRRVKRVRSGRELCGGILERALAMLVDVSATTKDPASRRLTEKESGSEAATCGFIDTEQTTLEIVREQGLDM